MTVLMSFVGLIVFVPSLFTVGFKSAWKRLWACAFAGFCIDLFIVLLSVIISLSLNY